MEKLSKQHMALRIISEWSFKIVGDDPLVKDWSEKINEKTKSTILVCAVSSDS